MVWLCFLSLKANLTSKATGSATLMRGKSATCRLRTLLLSSGLPTRHGQRPVRL